MFDKNAIVGLIDGIKSGVTVQGLNNRTEITQVSISAESMDEGLASNAREALGSLMEVVENTINTVISNEEDSAIEFNPAQLRAAKLVAGMAMNPSATRENLGNLKAVDAKNVVGTVTGHDLGLEDMVEASEISMESFDGQTLNSAVYFSVVYNLLASKQDAFGEAFFPTITIDPTSSGATIEARVINLYDEFTRGVSGASDKNKFNKISIVKAVTDPSILTVVKNKVVPVLRTENEAVLDKTLSSVNKEKGIEITTAPIKFGKTVSLLGVSQTDAQIAKGVMDNTDSLDRRVQMQDVFFDISGKDANDVAKTETFKVNISSMPHSNFTYLSQGHNKGLALSFDTDGIILNTSSSKLWNGAGSEVLAQLPANYTVRLNVVLHGDGNVHLGDVAVYSSAFSIVEIKDAGGNVLASTNPVYTQIAEVINTFTPRAYSVEAYTTNSNIRQRGQLVGVDIHNQIYTVPLRSGITVLKTVGNNNDTDNDATYLASQITFTGIMLSLNAVNTLVNFAETLRNMTMNGSVKDIAILGVSRFFVDAYYNEINYDITTNVDSRRSGERTEDIQKAMIARIRDEVTKMFVSSNYGIAKSIIPGSSTGKTLVVIGTDTRISQLLTDGDLYGKTSINIGDQFEVKIVSTMNPLVDGKMYITFGDNTATKNEKVNPLGFGCTFWSPELSLDVVANRGGSIVRELSTMPRFMHVAQLPIMSIINVSGITDSLGKVTSNYKVI